MDEKMEGETINFIKVWFSIFVFLCCCYHIGKTTPKGKTRLLFLLPFICFFFYLPLNLSSILISGNTAFYISWLGNFKLLLFAFGKGPLSSHPSIPLSTFVLVACLPIKIQENPPPKSQNEVNPFPNKRNHKSPLNRAIKVVVWGFLILSHDYNDHIHPKIILCLYCLHLYIFLELVLAMVGALARSILGLELEPQFNEPYLSTSLQDFWGKRWNLMVSSILRPTVYEPVRNISQRVIGRRWASIPAVWATFLVSGIMHEVIYYYLLRVRPTWEVTWFFVLHGFCLTVEITIKKALKGKWHFSRLISGPLAILFVMVTGFWLFFPQLIRCKADVRAFEEFKALQAFLVDSSRVVFGPSVV